MSARNPDYLYVATDGDLFKIGISYQPSVRERYIGGRIIKLYHRPYAKALEDGVKYALHDWCVRGHEWFAVTEAEIMAEVRKLVRIFDDDEAMKRGIEPSKRPADGEPPYQPPFELEWL